MWYALIVAALSLAGAAVPLLHRPSHAQLQIYLSLAAGALLGAALFHLLPEASHYIQGDFGLPAVAGIAVVFFLQRYVAPHSHEIEPTGAGATNHHHDDHDDASTAQAQDATTHHHATGPFLTSSIAILSLSVHSLFDGVAIGAAVGSSDPALTAAVFLSVLIHKPMDGISVSALLLGAGVGRRKLWTIQGGYALLVPLGALVFHWTSGAIGDASALIGYALAFSAGTFLAIALTDLLPELHFHSHDRNKLSAALLAGLVMMWLTSLIGHVDHDASGDHARLSATTGIVVARAAVASPPGCKTDLAGLSSRRDAVKAPSQR